MVRRAYEVIYDIERADDSEEQRIIEYQKAVIEKLISTNKKQKELISMLMTKLKERGQNE